MQIQSKMEEEKTSPFPSLVTCQVAELGNNKSQTMIFWKKDRSIAALKKLTRWFVPCIMVGIAAGLAAIAFYWMLSLSQHFFLDFLAGYRPEGPVNEPPLLSPTTTPFSRWVLLVLPMFGGLLSGALVYWLAPEAEGHGTDAVIEVYHNQQKEIRKRVPFVKAIASAITIGTGGSAGREGPIAQIAAGVATIIGKAFHLTSHERRILMVAGMGAGVGAIFHAPLAGSLFAAEVLYRRMEFEDRVIAPSFICSIIAYAIFATRFGWKPLFASPDFIFRNPAELIPYLILAFVLAFGAYCYIRVFYGVRNRFRELKIPNYLKPALGGLVVGSIGYFLPEALGTGYGIIQDGFIGNVGWGLLLIVAFGKIITTAFSIGSGGSGGVFGPAVVIGGCLGGVVGLLSQVLFPNIPIQPGAFMIVGMAGFFSAAANTPISTIIMVSEMTGDYHLLVPSMWVCIIAYLLVNRSTIYEKQLLSPLDAPHHLDEMMSQVLQRLSVRDALRAPKREPATTIYEGMGLQEVLKKFTESHHTCFPVLDRQGQFLGMVNEQQLRAFITNRGLDALVVAKDLITQLPSVTENETLDSAIQKLAQVQDAELPVLDPYNSKKLIDTLSRRDLISAYNQRIMQK